MIFGDPAEKAAYESLLRAFNQRHPQIKVNLIHIPSQNDYRQRLVADFAAGTPSDVVLLNYRRYAPFAAKGVLQPLGQYLATSTLIKRSDFYPKALRPFYWQTDLMCIPQNLSSLVVYYNKVLFDQAGVSYPSPDWNWDDFLAAAQALTKDTNGDGITDQYGLGTEASIFRAAPFVWQHGGDIVDDPFAPTKLTLDAPASQEALQWFVDLQVRHHVAPDRVQEQAEDSESRFMNGRMGMFLNSRRGVPTYREAAKFDWDVAPLPWGERRAGILHSDAYCMAAASKNKPAAWTFIEFANSPEGQTIVAQSGRTVPSLRSVAESPAFLDPNTKPANSRVFLDVIRYVRAVPVMDTWPDIEDLVGEEIERAFYGEASVDEAIKTATANTQEYFRGYMGAGGGVEEEE
jgi:multiple sugar transport system substrate-binding protein